jgi:hypothetical protein
MKITEARNRYLFTTRIELPHEEGEDIDFIVLREPTLEEMQKFAGDDSKKNIEMLEKLFPKCLVDHSFVNDDNTKTVNQEVYNLLKESSSLYAEIINAWFKSIPFHSRLTKQPE